MDHDKIKTKIAIDRWGDPVDDTLGNFKAYLDDLAKSIGADDETGNVFIEHERGCYDEGDSITAYVWRWETDEECLARKAAEDADRKADAAACAARREVEERRVYEALKAKFG